jgi:hypothetical protein
VLQAKVRRVNRTGKRSLEDGSAEAGTVMPQSLFDRVLS